jgi:hypothetical protein
MIDWLQVKFYIGGYMKYRVIAVEYGSRLIDVELLKANSLRYAEERIFFFSTFLQHKHFVVRDKADNIVLEHLFDWTDILTDEQAERLMRDYPDF